MRTTGDETPCLHSSRVPNRHSRSGSKLPPRLCRCGPLPTLRNGVYRLAFGAIGISYLRISRNWFYLGLWPHEAYSGSPGLNARTSLLATHLSPSHYPRLRLRVGRCRTRCLILLPQCVAVVGYGRSVAPSHRPLRPTVLDARSSSRADDESVQQACFVHRARCSWNAGTAQVEWSRRLGRTDQCRKCDHRPMSVLSWS